MDEAGAEPRDRPQPERDRPPRPAITLMLVLAFSGGSISGYLTFQSVVMGAAPAGCGAGSGCAEVLSTKWSRWLGLPVSALATATYLVIIGALVALRSDRPSRREGAWRVLLTAGAAVAGAAVWFSYLQLFRIGAICWYCMGDHLAGLGLAIVIFREAPPLGSSPAAGRGLALSPSRKLGSIGAGLVAVVILALAQLAAPPQVHRVDSLPAGQDFDLGQGAARRIGVLGGQLHLDPEDEALIGSPDAPAIIAIMYDYSCPHCRHTHHLLREVRKDSGGELAVLALHLPMHRGCNPHAPESMPERFDHSCELARLALAVWLADRSRFVEFDRWLFEPEMPRSPREARAEAERLVGEAALTATLGDARVRARLERNVAAYAASGADRVPVTFAPHAQPVVGRVEEKQVILEIIEKSARARGAPAPGDL